MQFVFLPGMDGSGKLFEPLVRLWPAEWPKPVIIPYPDDRVMSYAELEAHIEPQLPRAGSWVLATESYGGPLAIRIASRRPAGLRGLVLSATFVRKPRGRLGVWASALVNPEIIRSQFFDPFLRLAMRAQRIPSQQVHWLSTVRGQTPPEIFAARMKDALAVDSLSELRHCDVPILCFYAKRDWILSSDRKDDIAAANPKVKVVGLDASHFLLQTRPAEAVEEMKKFVRTL